MTTPDGTSGGAGGKADEFETDGGVDVPGADAGLAQLEMTGTCSVTVTSFSGGYGYPSTSSEPIELEVRVAEVDAEGNAVGVVHVASPWDNIPADMWRAWCHAAHQDFQPPTSACAIGPYDISTEALGFGQGFVSFKSAEDGYTMYISAFAEIGRDSYYDPSWTKESFSCSLR